MLKERHINPSDHIAPVRFQLILGALLTFAFLFAYGEVVSALAHQWWSNDMYSYGFLIPWISLYLIWIRREKLRLLQPIPHAFSGLATLLLGLLMLFVGHVGGISILQALSVIVTLTGTVLLLLGRHFLKVLWFPIAYLLFMMPIWDILTDRLHLPFQLFSATIGVTLLELLGIPAYRDGVYLELPNITLEVAKACSGINYLIAVIAISVPMAYLFLKTWPRRIFLVCLAVATAILANGLRVTLIGILSYNNISGDIHGPFHMLQGLFVSVVGYIAIFVGLWALSPSLSPASLHKEETPSIPPAIRKRINPYLVSSVAILFLLTGSYLTFYRPPGVPLSTDLQYFPVDVGKWKGRNIPPDDTVYRNLGVDHELSRVYETSAGEMLQLYIGYFEYQKQAKELVNYQTEDLHRSATKIRLDLASSKAIEVNKVVQRDKNGYKLTFFWFDLNGRIVTDRAKAKVDAIWRALTSGKTNGAVIMITADGRTPDELPQIASNAEDFTKEILPILPKYLPGELKNSL